jgi:hypothetical protein
MLREIAGVVSPDPLTQRRWFQSDFFDLFVWSLKSSEEITSLQVCYAKTRNERAITWRSGVGFYHDGVDEGGDSSHAATPLLRASAQWTPEKVNARFLAESQNIEPGLRKFVLAKLHEFALVGPIPRNQPPRKTVRREDWQKSPPQE